MDNVIVEDLGQGATREVSSNAPAVETRNARVTTVGLFRADDVAASATASMTLGAVDANAPEGYVAPRAGKVVGITSQSSAAVSSGTATLQATIGGTGSGGTVVVSSTSGTSQVTDFAEADQASFAAGAVLGCDVVSASLDPTTLDFSAWLVVRWDAE